MRDADLCVLLKRQPRRIPEHGVGIVRYRDPSISHPRRPAIRLDAKKESSRLAELRVGGQSQSARQKQNAQE